jgi:hypothetical protein
MRARFLSAMLLAVLLASCSTPERAKSRPASALPPPSQSCVRIANTSSNVVALQIAIRKFVPAHGKGAAVWLTGVSHIGDSNYYAALQKHLDAQRLVLFEGVSATPDGPARGAGSGPSGPAQPDRQDRPTLQAAMAKSLGLVFQLDAIDYRRPNFRGSDLSVAQLRKVFDEMPPSDAGSDASQGFENLLQLMQGGSLFEGLVQIGLGVIGSSPNLQGLAKLALIETLGQLNGDPARLRGLSPGLKQLLDVLVERRNQKVIADLKAELKKPANGGSIAIFYGTGHMPDLETRMRNELHYRPAEEIWLNAFSVNLVEAGISPGEALLMHSMVKRQLDSGITP